MKVYESMTRIEAAYPLIVRVWRQEEAACGSFLNSDLHQCVERLCDNGTPQPHEIVEEISKLPRVNAVEVIDKHTGCGILCYPEWP